MSAELPRLLKGVQSVPVPDYEARQARKDLKILAATAFKRHADYLNTFPCNNGGMSICLDLRTSGDVISYLAFSLSSFRSKGRESLSVSVAREFKDAEHFSPDALERMDWIEDGQRLGSRRLCDYYYDDHDKTGAPYLWRSDWDFHHRRGVFVDEDGTCTPDEFCELILEDGGHMVQVGRLEVSGLGILLANAFPHVPQDESSSAA